MYHSSEEDNPEQVLHPVEESDYTVVPFDEVFDPAGRHINCPECAEILAQLGGGSLRRPKAPPRDQWAE
jgi:hypothetical protein